MVAADSPSSDADGSTDSESLRRRALALPPASGSNVPPSSGGSGVPERKTAEPDAAPEMATVAETAEPEVAETIAAPDEAEPPAPAGD